MKRLLKFILVLALGAGLLVVASALFPEDDAEGEESDEEHPYGEPDGKVTQKDVASFVD